MIGFLTGSIHSKLNDYVILMVNGVGYSVTVPPNTLSSLQLHQPLELYIYTNVKDDAIDLYGFRSGPELAFFKQILKVSGIGPKTAILVIDKGVEPLREAIIKADTDFFLTIPRLGVKNAQRIIIELKNKLGGISELDLSGTPSEMTEVIEALQSMGISRSESLKAIKNLPPDTSLEQKITLVLRQIGKSK